MKNSFYALLVIQTANFVHSRYAGSSNRIENMNAGSMVRGMENRVYICPKEFLRIGNSCLYLSNEKASWHDAQYRCRKMASNTTLAVFEKKWENKHAKSFLNTPGSVPKHRWIGGIFNSKSKQWLWGPSGNELMYNEKFKKRTAAKEHKFLWMCLMMNAKKEYNWKADDCLRKKYYICKTTLKLRKDPKVYLEYQILKNEILQ